MSPPIEPLSDWPELPTGDRPITRNKSFVLHPDQLEIVERAIRVAKALGPFDHANTNGNGNALERIARLYLEANGLG